MNERRPLPDAKPVDSLGPYRILSLSGGGYRGLFTARLLAHLKSMDEYKGVPIGQRFDMIAGTSVGGIIAVALALGEPAEKIVKILTEQGSRIFPRMRFKNIAKLFGREVYSVAPLEKAIRDCIGATATTPFFDIRKSILLTTVSWTAGRLVLLGTGTARQATSPKVCSVLDALCAGAAAPAHFPARKIEGDWYVDGGLAANCPDLHALQQSIHLERRIFMLSVGTASVARGSSPDQMPQRGITWAGPALDLSIHAQEIMARDACEKQLQGAYLHLNKHPGIDQAVLKKLDYATPNSTAMLLTLADARFKELREDPAQMRALKQIISPAPLPDGP